MTHPNLVSTHSPKDVFAKLGELEPDEIARLLGDAEVKAICGNRFSCAIARYVSAETGWVVDVGNSSWHANLYDKNMHHLAQQDGELAAGPREFVIRFDGRCYPELVDWAGMAELIGSSDPTGQTP